MSDSDEVGSHSDEPMYVTRAQHELSTQDAANERALLNSTVADLGLAVADLKADGQASLARIMAAIQERNAAPGPSAGSLPGPATPPRHRGAAGLGLFSSGPPGGMGRSGSAPGVFPGSAALTTAASAAMGGGLMPGAAPAVLGNPHVGFGAWGASGESVSAS